jgi:hypothetical protein
MPRFLLIRFMKSAGMMLSWHCPCDGQGPVVPMIEESHGGLQTGLQKAERIDFPEDFGSFIGRLSALLKRACTRQGSNLQPCDPKSHTLSN